MHIWPKFLLVVAFAATPTSIFAATAKDQASANALILAANPSFYAGEKDNKKYLEAAIAYVEALPWYESQNDTYTIRQLNAAIYYCRHKASNNTIDSFQAEHLLEPTALNALDRLNKLFISPIAANQAGEYLNFAQTFIEKNPTRAFMGAVLYFEFSERFFSQTESAQAKQRMEQLFARHEKLLDKKIISKKDIIIDQATTTTAAAPIARSPMPSESTLQTSIAAIHELFKSDYSSIKGRSGLVTKLMKQAQQTENDPSSVYALLFEARELSISAKNVFKVLEICDLMAELFEIADINAEKKIGALKSSWPKHCDIVN